VQHAAPADAGTRNHWVQMLTAKREAVRKKWETWMAFQGGEEHQMNVELWKRGRRWQSHDPRSTPWISSPCPGSLSRCPSSLSSLSRAWHYCNLGLLEVVLNRIARTYNSTASFQTLVSVSYSLGPAAAHPKLTPILSVTVLSSCSSRRAMESSPLFAPLQPSTHPAPRPITGETRMPISTPPRNIF